MAHKVTLTIDGHHISARPGTSVLEAALLHGVYIPHLCYDKDLKPHGGCRLCIVEIKGMKGLPAACATAVAESMSVTTFSPAVNLVRRDTLELLLAEHPLDCLTCIKNQQCELQKVVAQVAGLERTLRRTGKPEDIDDLTPYFSYDRSYCILCQKCVRACDEVVKKDIITIINRGSESRVATFAGEAEKALACPDCLECVKRCPTAALRKTAGSVIFKA